MNQFIRALFYDDSLLAAYVLHFCLVVSRLPPLFRDLCTFTIVTNSFISL